MINPLLEMKSITKEFPGVRALDQVSFAVEHGEIHALCGENGAGKSTLIKILGGVHPYGTYQGTLRIEKRDQQFHSVRDAKKSGVAIIHQELTLIPKLTVAENIFLGREQTKLGIIDHHQLYSDTNRLLKDFALCIPIQTPIEHLGIGQQQMVEIIKVLSQDARVLVLDEPTAALTEAEIKALLQILNQLRDKGITCIYNHP